MPIFKCPNMANILEKKNFQTIFVTHGKIKMKV